MLCFHLRPLLTDLSLSDKTTKDEPKVCGFDCLDDPYFCCVDTGILLSLLSGLNFNTWPVYYTENYHGK